LKLKKNILTCFQLQADNCIIFNSSIIYFNILVNYGYLAKTTRVRCGSDCSASACCTTGLSSNLGPAPLEEALYRADAEDNKSSSLRVVYVNVNVKISATNQTIPLLHLMLTSQITTHIFNWKKSTPIVWSKHIY
jgi:hypothetical protein